MANKPKKGRMPEYRLKVFDKTTEFGGEVGAGWLNTDGSITVKLDPCVVLSEVNLRNSGVLTLFLSEYTPPAKPEDFKKSKGQGSLNDIADI